MTQTRKGKLYNNNGPPNLPKEGDGVQKFHLTWKKPGEGLTVLMANRILQTGKEGRKQQ